MPVISLYPSHWQNADAALKREWIVTNGLGGWASGTIGGANTRRYHGALVAALHPPVDRRVLVNKLDDWIMVKDVRYGLTANEFADGTVDPRGWEHLQKFELNEGIPHWHYAVGDVRLRKTVFMPYGHNAAWVIYYYHYGNTPIRVEITPILNHRDFHAETTRSTEWQPTFDPLEGGTKVRLFSGAHPIWLVYPGAQFEPKPVWIEKFHHRAEQERGEPATEDALMVGTVRAVLTPGDTFAMLISAEAPSPAAYHWRADLESVQTRHRTLAAQSRLPADSPDWVRQLALAADQFVVARTDSGLPIISKWRSSEQRSDSNKTVIAGYHWFSDWGRDTMIALPGLCLSTRRYAEAAAILRTFAQHISQGMLPNRFPDSGEQPEYNTVDATLWYFHAIDRYVEASGDETLARELFPALEDIVGWHLRGTRYNIRCDADGLVYAGEPGVQLTWMDAKVNDWVVTPRIGKPVEISALWINALRVMQALTTRLGITPAHDYGALAAKALKGFDKFWNKATGCLYDVIDVPDLRGLVFRSEAKNPVGLSRDSSIRPNQLFAISLPYAPIEASSERAKSIVEVCQRELLTPYGLRSLAPGSPDYKPHFGGARLIRDGAYHQGTVWGWLIGPFVEAHYKVYGDKEAALRFLQPLEEATTTYGVGSLAEVYDATAPFKPGGCMAQAWSVAEALRVWRLLRG